MSTTFDESGRNMLMTFSNRPATNRSAQNKDSTHAQLQKYTRMQRMVTDTRLVVYCLISIVFAIVLTLIINIVNKDYSLRPISTHCPFVWGFLPTSGIISVFLFVAYPVLLAKVWKTQDVLGIRSDLIICETVGTVSMIVTVVWELALDDIRQHWSGLFFIWIGAFLIHISSVAVPLFRSIKHTRSVYRQLHRPGTSSSNTAMMNPYTGSEHGAVRVRRDEFNMMLGNAYEYSRFRKYAASCFCSELAALLDEYQALKASAVLAFGSLSEENSSVPATPTSMTSRTSESIQPNEFLHNHGLTLQKYVVAPHTPHTMAPGLDYANASGVHTSITVSILDTIKSAYPNRRINERTQFPASLKDKILSVFAIYINSKSYMAVNVPQSMVRKIEDHLRADEITLAVLDEVKDEVLFMLYADVYTRFRAEKQ
ncbi:hypothetical protein FBU59_003891 [Linderina macrospora]|uniref:Uncharacterized protein n=1 Tax=Linderina macrospora TaxID=4868 RepID=A0ACC1J766_9FUNG|nr:hypothetical protein FBU59_003891 [Linderina macrospora]